MATHERLRATGRWCGVLLAAWLVGDTAAAGSVQWSRTYGDGRHAAASLASTPDGGLLVAGGMTPEAPTTTADGWLVKLDGAGKPLWQKRVHGRAGNAFDVVHAVPGGSIAAGSTAGTPPAYLESLVTRLDATGDVLWQTRLGVGNSLRIHDVRATGDDGYVAVGDSTAVVVADHYYDGCVVRLDATGKVLWQRSYARQGRPTSSLRHVRPLAGGGFLLAGVIHPEMTSSAEANAWLMEIDAAGDIVWEKVYADGSDTFHVAGLEETPDGGFVVVGDTYPDGLDWNYGWIAKLGRRGDVEWQKAVGPLYRNTWMRAVQPAADGSFVAVGETWVTPLGNNTADAVWWKIDAAGNVIWQRSLGGALRESFTSLAAVAGGYAALGWTESYGTASSAAWIVGLDPSGAVTGCLDERWTTPVVRPATARVSSGTAMSDPVPVRQTGSEAVASAAGSPVVWQQCPVAVPYTQLVAVEYYHAAYDHYFVTTNLDEMAELESGEEIRGWSRTSAWFRAIGADSGAAPMCRFWSGKTFAPKSSHFMTAFGFECDKVMANPDWIYEGDVFATILPDAAGHCPAATIPLYRFYNDGQGGAPNHRYVTKGADRAAMIVRRWVPEGAGDGVAGCVPPD